MHTGPAPARLKLVSGRALPETCPSLTVCGPLESHCSSEQYVINTIFVVGVTVVFLVASHQSNGKSRVLNSDTSQ